MISALKRSVVHGLRARGWELRHLNALKVAGPYPHSRLYPEATYAPWQGDAEFMKVYNLIRQHTLVDIYRCYEIWSLAGQLGKLPPGATLEVGVWRGGTGALVAKKCALIGVKETVYLCDTFRGVVKTSALDTSYRDGTHSDTSAQIVSDLLTRVADGQDLHVEILEGIFPEETGDRISSCKFRYCHIDVDVYSSARDIVHWVWDRLVPGGIVVFDDYGFEPCDGVTRLVEEEAHRENALLLYNLNGHAILVRLS